VRARFSKVHSAYVDCIYIHSIHVDIGTSEPELSLCTIRENTQYDCRMSDSKQDIWVARVTSQTAEIAMKKQDRKNV
jgi:hypothetical protein